MKHEIFAYTSTRFTAADASALRQSMIELAAGGGWSHGAPEYAEDTEAEAATDPQDEPITGAVLAVGDIGQENWSPVRELTVFLEALARFSEDRGVDMEVLLDKTYVGEIRSGKMDRLLREGLIATW